MLHPSSIRRSFVVSALPLLALVAGPAVSPAEAEEQTCVECHRSPDFRVKSKKLYEYYQAFEKSIHGVIGLECGDCHGGHPGAGSLEAIHEGVMDPVRFDHIPETCGACHEEQLESFVQSDHYQKLMNDGSAPNCVTCHGAMDMDFYFTSLVRTTCTFCHNPSKDIAPDVPDRAEYILSKINVIKGYRAFVRKIQHDEEALDEIEESYQRLTGYWHLFDLDRVESETEHLLDLLRQEKAKALEYKRDHRLESRK
jgi:hypothetical protein